MHLFITDFAIEQEQVRVSEERVVKHMGKVLRMKKWEMFMLQQLRYYDTLWEQETRYVVEIISLDKKEIYGNIVECKTLVKKLSKTRKISLCVALPNTASKLSFITQKLTEVGVDEIIFRKAQRSQMKKLSTEKIEKLQKIALEASEQSQRWSVPVVRYVDNLHNIVRNGKIIVFDIDDMDEMKSDEESEEVRWNTSLCSSNIPLQKENSCSDVFGIIWPEGGLSKKDYDSFWFDYSIESLGETVLRMETATIVGGWKCVNWMLT